MKYILLLAAAIMFSACSSAPKHDHKEGHHHADGSACGCADHKDQAKDHEHKEGMCTECGAMNEKKDQLTAAASAWGLSGNPQLKSEISEEAFKKTYEKKKKQLDKECVTAAMEYCGKTTKDLAVTESEVQCLWTKSQRVTRETLPQLDRTACDKTLKSFPVMKTMKK